MCSDRNATIPQNPLFDASVEIDYTERESEKSRQFGIQYFEACLVALRRTPIGKAII